MNFVVLRCGTRLCLKLVFLILTQFDKIVYLDYDIVIRNIDELFNYLIYQL